MEEEEEEREGKRQSGCMAFLPLLSDSLRPLSSDRRTSLCFVPPLVSVARRGQKAGDFGGRGWGGNGPPPPAACWSFHLNPSSGDGWGGAVGRLALGGGKGVLVVGCRVGWSLLQRGSTRKCHRPWPHDLAHTHPSGGDQAGSPCSPDPSLFIHFHVVRSSSELSLPLREVDAPYDNLLPSHPDLV